MKKTMTIVFAFLMLCVCSVNFFPVNVVNAQGPYYKIPDYENFRPNRAANDIEAIVNGKSVINSTAENNTVYIDGAAVAREHGEAVEEINGYITKLNNRGMYLTRDLVNIVTVKANNINFSEFVEIVIDEENIKQISDINTLKIILDKNSEYIALDKESIVYISENYGKFKFQIKKLSDTYTVRFLDSGNNIISKYNVDIKIALPAKHSEQTVYLFMDNTQENWGGQYNPSTGAMEFMAKYSGEYNVASPEIVINDIDSLEEYEKQAIRFMVVRGYFELSNNKFDPDSDLTRYAFAESLVRMFFALDNEAQCTFPDVNRKYYRYVAASQKDNIVQGFPDGTFGGNEKVTAEQVIALTARTINQKNGYVYPENVQKYMDFGSENTMGKWAEKEIALAMREGIYSKDMNLKFTENISRKDAAVILYRLFMIMNNTPEPTEIIEYDVDGKTARDTFWTKTNAIIVCSAVVVVNAAALILAILFLKKRKNGE